LQVASLFPAPIKRSHCREDVIDWHGALRAGRLPKRGAISNCGSIRSPGCKDGAFDFGLEARVMRNIEWM